MTARWRLHRAGIQNVWHYWDAEFVLTGGRMVLRGTNGSGKSRALELLLPFLLDADRRRMDSSGSAAVNLDRLMKVGGSESGNRVGYLWLELAHAEAGGEADRYLTLGAHLRWSAATGAVRVHWFITERRVGHDLPLLDGDRQALSREDLGRLIGTEQVTDSAETHRERVRAQVFGLVDARAEERFEGLTQLLHTLRSPDVGNRIDEGRLPALLSDALPPLSQATLDAAGAKLDEISETRALQDRLERSTADLETFLAAYRRYAQGELGAAAGQARGAGRQAVRAEKAARAAEAGRVEAETAAVDAAAAHAEAAEHLTEVEAALRGLQDSAEHRDLLERAETVKALRATAVVAADAADRARQTEHDAAGRVRREVDEAAEAAARVTGRLAELAGHTGDGVPNPLPAEVGVRRVVVPGATDVVRVRPDGDPAPLVRPDRAGLDLGDADPARWARETQAVRQAAADRRQLLDTRLAEHHRLVRAEQAVVAAEDRRDRAADGEQASRERRDTAVEAEHAALDELRAGWAAWLALPSTTDLLAGAEWAASAVGPFLAGGEPDLDALDRAADVAAEPARGRVEQDRAGLAHQRTLLAERRSELEARRTRLLAEEDPEPESPSWATGRVSTPLWRAVDFAPGTDPADHAGIEAALIASGLLTATLTAEGAVAAGDLVVDAAGAPVDRPLSEVLVAEAGAPAELVSAVLARIGWADRHGTCWLDRDGSFRLGVLTGRHEVPHARHIGTTARARHRAEQLATLEAELAALAEDTARVVARLAELADRLAVLRRHVATAPRSAAVRQAGSDLRSAEADLTRLVAEVARLSRAAVEARSAWDTDEQRHAAACGRLGLEADEAVLTSARERAQRSMAAAETVGTALAELRRALDRVVAADLAADRATGQRRTAEEGADRDRGVWHTAATALAAAEQAAGLDADQARAELRRAEQEAVAAREVESAARARASDTHDAELRARFTAESAAAEWTAARAVADSAEATLRVRAELPGLAESAGVADLPATGPLTEPLLAGLPDPLPEPDVEGYLAALRDLEKKRDPGDYDLLPSVRDGVHLVAVTEATGRRTLPGAVAELVRRRDAGRVALTEREQKVFTTFVLGSVADELRQQLLWSTRQVELMNERTSGLRTSHGIGVEIQWPLADDASGSAKRIEELVRTRASARSAEANAELTELLRARVEEQLRTDPAQGYASALRAALDHRSWHTVDVYILGPADGERRKISRRARLSQGETRVVSYLALFAAADAFYAGLPDPGALRLILLDDAFAKVDERTVGELMVQLVRLDLDFVMTGHALWGFGPGVPSLDVYEVRRAEGTAAITTRVHWDGTTRHVFT